MQSDEMYETPEFEQVEHPSLEPQEPQLPEDVNLAEKLDESELNEIANIVITEFEEDLTSREEWAEKHAEWLNIYFQKDKSKIPPWDGSSTESIPVLAEAVNQFQSRSYRAFFPNRYFIDAIPVGAPSTDARERADRVAKHMSFQLGVLDRTYKPNKNQMFMAVALHGSDFTKTYFSRTKRRTVIERVRAQDLVVPYGIGPRDIEDIERKTQIKWQSLNETKILKANGWFLEEGEPYDATMAGDTQLDQAEEHGDMLQQSASYQSNENMCCTLEQHRLLDLDEDGIGEPYIVWVDRQSKKVQRIQIRYEVDETGLPVENKEPIEYYTHYQFLPNPDGFYGLGFGHLLADMNTAVNKLQRMFIDANELSVVGNLTYLVSDQLGLPGDEFDLSLGRGIKIPRSVEDVRKHFMKLDFQPPGQETMQMIQTITEHAQRLSANTDVLSGQPDKVYQPTTMLSMVEQGLQLFSSVQEFLGVSMEKELQKIARLNGKYLEQGEEFLFGDQQIQVSPEDYRDDFRIVPVFDPKYSTRSQKLAKAQAIYQFVMENPLTAQDGESIYLASKSVLEALDTENLDAVLKQPQIPQPTRIDDQNLENTYFLMPPEKRPLFDVFPDQDHIRHIQVIDKFVAYLDLATPMDVNNTEAGGYYNKTMQPPEGKLPAQEESKPGVTGLPNAAGGDPQISKLISTLSAEQKEQLIANLLRHRSLHVAYMFGQLNGVLDGQGNPIVPNPAGSTGSMETTPSDQLGLDEIMSGLSAITSTPNL